MKNRTVLGIVCIVLSLVICFVFAPLLSSEGKTITAYVTVHEISHGKQITENDITAVNLPSSELSESAVTALSDMVGLYAAVDMVSGDIILSSKLTDSANSPDAVYGSLNGSQRVMSVTISSFAGGLSGKLKSGDIISIHVVDKETGEASVPSELMYIRVITATTSGGVDEENITVNEDGTYTIPTTVTLLVSQRQANLLARYEASGKIHISLVYRGNEKTAQAFLDAQKEALNG